MPDGALDALHERGARFDESTPGHGIGLAIVRDIAVSYGGSLAAGRSELGGAEFRITIPPAASAKG